MKDFDSPDLRENEINGRISEKVKKRRSEIIRIDMKVIETKRLVLRPWNEGDAGDFYEYAADPEVGPSAGWAVHYNRDISGRILQRYIEDDDTWAVALKDCGKAIGCIGFHRDTIRPYDGVKMLGFVLNRAFWGKGYMPEAAQAAMGFGFDEMGLAVVSAYHYDFNTRSKRVLEKIGFAFEGIMRSAAALHDGTVVSRCCYSMTKDDYKLIKSKKLHGRIER